MWTAKVPKRRVRPPSRQLCQMVHETIRRIKMASKWHQNVQCCNHAQRDWLRPSRLVEKSYAHVAVDLLALWPSLTCRPLLL